MKAFDNKTTGVITPMELKSFKYKLLYWSVVAILLLLVCLSLVPSLWVMLSGFKDVKEIYKVPPDLFPKHIKLSKAILVWNKYKLSSSYISSIIIAVGDVACSVVFPALGGFVLSRLRPKGHRLVFTLLLWTMMMPGQVRMVPTFMVFNSAHLTNSYIPLWMMAAANIFNVFLFKNYFDTISISLIEAAQLDGCTDMGIFSKIILPLAKPIVIYVVITSINTAWSSFMWPMLLISDDAKLPIAVKLYNLKTSVRLDYYMIAIIFGMIPPVILYAFFQRMILGGVNVGGVKG